MSKTRDQFRSQLLSRNSEPLTDREYDYRTYLRGHGASLGALLDRIADTPQLVEDRVGGVEHRDE